MVRVSSRLLPFFIAFFVGVVGTVVGTIIVSAHGGDLSKIHACIKTANGSVRIVGANDTCTSSETALDWNIQGVPGPSGPPGPSGSSGDLPPQLTYIANASSNSISVIDPTKNPPFVSIRVGKSPQIILKNPSGTRLYVVNYNDFKATVSVIDTTSGENIATIPVGKQPRSAMLNSAGTRLYVANFTSNTVSVIDTTSNTVTATIPAGQLPALLAINPSGSKLYVNNVENNTITVIDTSNNTVAATISAESDVNSSFNNSNAKHMVFNAGGTQGYVVNGDKAKIFVIDTSNNTVAQTITVGQNASAIAVNPAGNRVYVASEQTISVIDTASNTVVDSIAIVGSDLNNMIINSSGTKLYIVQSLTDTLSVIDTTNNTVAATVPVGNSPSAIAIDSGSSHVYVVNSASDDMSVIDTATYKETVVKTGKLPRDVLVP